MSVGSYLSALDYASCGLRVLPINAASKIPAVKEWPEKASTNKTTIRRWFTGRNADRNIGLAMGDGVFAVDIDCKQGGFNSFLNIVENHEIPETANAITASGGCHYLFRTAQKVGNSVGVKPGIDIRGDGGQIVVAPSIITPDEYYTWVEHPANGIAEAPSWLIDQLLTPSPASSLRSDSRPLTTFEKTGDIGELTADIIGRFPVKTVGTRNKVMCSAICSLLSRGYSPEITEDVIYRWWEHGYEQGVIGTNPEKGRRELRSAIRSIIDSQSLVVSSVDHQANIRAITLSPGQVSLINSLGTQSTHTGDSNIIQIGVTSPLDCMFVEAVLVHFTYEMSKSDGPTYLATFNQFADIILDRHGKRLNPNQCERLKKKYFTRNGRKANSLELVIQTEKGHTGKPSEYLLTGLIYFMGGDNPISIEQGESTCVGF